MNREETLAAVPIEYERFVRDTHLSHNELTEFDRMMFQAAFVIGAEWALKNTLKRAQEAA
jgi:TRAP-type mannitol/chloroaromatic compound transport system permease small subunit